MRSVATVTLAPSVTRLTTLERVKIELNITSGADDAILGAKIDEATSDIEAQIARTLSRATLSEIFWGGAGHAEYLILARSPVASIASVTVDDVAVDLGEVRIDAETGQLYRLDASGYACAWAWSKEVTVVFAAGYLLPGEAGRDLPPALEGAAIELLASYWQSRGRDPMVKAEEVPGVMRKEYWVGSVGAEGELPPSVMTKISPFRRVLV
jgi:uncharacterized phiE125 gp8 family phage protein